VGAHPSKNEKERERGKATGELGGQGINLRPIKGGGGEKQPKRGSHMVGKSSPWKEKTKKGSRNISMPKMRTIGIGGVGEKGNTTCFEGTRKENHEMGLSKKKGTPKKKKNRPFGDEHKKESVSKGRGKKSGRKVEKKKKPQARRTAATGGETEEDPNGDAQKGKKGREGKGGPIISGVTRKNQEVFADGVQKRLQHLGDERERSREKIEKERWRGEVRMNGGMVGETRRREGRIAGKREERGRG